MFKFHDNGRVSVALSRPRQDGSAMCAYIVETADINGPPDGRASAARRTTLRRTGGTVQWPLAVFLPSGNNVQSTTPMYGLNVPQSAAVAYLDGPCLVLAGAGSGKTRVITQKIAHLIEDRGYDPRTIAALTFTNKAALEMQERIAKLLKQPKQAKQLTVSTFHSLGVKILRQEAHGVGLKDRFSIMDSDDCASLVQDLAITTDKQLIRRIQTAISLWKNGLVDPEIALQ